MVMLSKLFSAGKFDVGQTLSQQTLGTRAYILILHTGQIYMPFHSMENFTALCNTHAGAKTHTLAHIHLRRSSTIQQKNSS